jgi:hypothetical protein
VAKFVNKKNDPNVDWYEPKWNECPYYKGFFFSNIWEVVFLGNCFPYQLNPLLLQGNAFKGKLFSRGSCSMGQLSPLVQQE